MAMWEIGCPKDCDCLGFGHNNLEITNKRGGMMPKRTFTVKPIEIGDLSALDLQEEAEFYEGTSMFNSPHPYRITIYDDQGMNPEAETAQAVFCPPFGLGHGGGTYGTEGRLGIAWGAEATWADAESVETGIEMWLNDTEAWEARN